MILTCDNIHNYIGGIAQYANHEEFIGKIILKDDINLGTFFTRPDIIYLIHKFTNFGTANQKLIDPSIYPKDLLINNVYSLITDFELSTGAWILISPPPIIKTIIHKTRFSILR